ncbi:tetratricopeptide repeat protein 36 homolog [Rhynchophorus ferrugineus]|uniref:Tetratricopeptide repeat protein 36 n=1 Tax=Rhynchophorus ferrugineus TaxID=354439 RepID=A0A834IN15_RHYFE|nr:hypothetical protein GWI33_005532 [Rhynchophorus ferrugineus]
MALGDYDKAVLTCVFNPNLPIEEVEVNPTAELKDEEQCTSLNLQTQQIEIEAIRLAECGKLEDALNLINSAIELAPERPSLYNNKAHMLQYLRRFDDAFETLTLCIALCTQKHRKTLSQACAQRGVLHKRAKRLKEARMDFEEAAKLGSTFAKSQLIDLNPYAAICNQMLRQVMDELN